MRKTLVILNLIFIFLLTGCLSQSINVISDVEELPNNITIELSAESSIMLVGETQTISATANLEGALFSWRSLNEEIISVGSNGTIEALALGTATIQAILVQNETIKGNILIEVVESPINITLEGKTEAHVGEMFEVIANISPSTSFDDIEWSSSDVEKAIVVNGLVKLLSEGKVTIKASSIANALIFGELTLNILAPVTPTDITVNDITEVSINQTKRISYYVLPNNASREVVWTSSDDSVIVVDKNGQIFGKSLGQATIRLESIYDDLVFEEVVIECKVDENNSSNLETTIQNVIENSLPALVGISNYQLSSLTNTTFLHSKGSGVIYKVMIINNDLDIIEYDENYDQQNIKEYLYYAVTNRHVIENSSYIKVYIGSKDKEYNASLVAFDDKTDLAVVSFKFNEYFEPLLFGNTSDIKSGTFVIALGNPNGTEYFGTSTLGIVSYPKRYINDDLDGDGIGDWHSEYIQHDGAINHGNSGGPLLNLRGEIIGINTLKMVSDSIESMGFAIPSHIITPQLSTLENGQTPVRASFGLVAMTVKEILERDDNLYEIPEGIDYGVYVTTVNPDSVGANALIEPGDIILSLNQIDLIYIYQVRIELGKVVVGNNQTLTASVYKKTTSQIETVEFIFP